MATGKQLKLLLWKNWVFKWRKRRELLAEILFPIGLIILLLCCRLIFTVEKDDHATVWPAFSVDKFPQTIATLGSMEPSGRWRIVYTPDDPKTTKLMHKVVEQLHVDIQGNLNYIACLICSIVTC